MENSALEGEDNQLLQIYFLDVGVDLVVNSHQATISWSAAPKFLCIV
jgi:hypothetical protein